MRLLCTVLLLALFPIPTAHAQDESLGDIARRELERKKAQQASSQPAPAGAADAEGFTWIRENDRSANYVVFGFASSSSVAGRETHVMAGECEASCLKQPDCKAYKLAPEQDRQGRTIYKCSVKRAITQPSAAVGGVDAAGFTWVRQGSPSQGFFTTPFTGAEGEGTADGCRSYCERQHCLAYKFGHRQIRGKDTATCAIKDAESEEEEMAPAMGSLLMYSALVKSAMSLPPELAKFSTAEKRALGNLLLLAFSEKACHDMMGRFLTLAQFETVTCKDESGFGLVELGPLPAEVTAGLNRDADYTLTLDTAGQAPIITSAPKGPGLASFYYDGARVHSQAGGPATGTSPSMGTEEEIAKAIMNAQPKDKPQQAATAAPAAGTKTAPSAAAGAKPTSPVARHVYTNDEIPSVSPTASSSSAAVRDKSDPFVAPVATTDADTDRPGFTDVLQPLGPLAQADVCQRLCDQLSTCVAWVFHRASSGNQCELKKAVTPAVQKAGYTSGVKAGARIPPPRPNP
jgi:hypothetical protein